MNSAAVMNESALSSNKKVLKVVGVTALLALALWAMLMPEMAMAAGDTSLGNTSHADDFDDIWQTIVGWTQGSLGRVIAGTMILVGIIGGIARQSLMAFAVGIAGGMGLTYAPNIINTVIGASIENANTATLAAMQFANGLGM